MLSSEMVKQRQISLEQQLKTELLDDDLQVEIRTVFGALKILTEADRLSSTAIENMWSQVKDIFENHLIVYLALFEVFADLYHAAYEQEIQDELGSKRYASLFQLRSMQFTHRELSQLADDGCITHESRDEPAEAPSSGRVIRHYFKLNYGGMRLWERTSEMETNENQVLAAVLTLKRERKELNMPEIQLSENERRREAWPLAEARTRDGMGALNQGKVKKATELIGIIVGKQ